MRTHAGATRHIELFPVTARDRMLRRCKDKGSRLPHSTGPGLASWKFLSREHCTVTAWWNSRTLIVS